MELKQNNTYIFKEKTNIHTPTIMKGKILELTKTSIQVINLDSNITFRNELKDFSWVAIELIPNFDGKLIDLIKKHKIFKPMEFQKYENPVVRKCIGPCFCDGSCGNDVNSIHWKFICNLK